MTSRWTAYIPYPFVAGLLAGDAFLGRARRFQAAALFADISGFTAMSEALKASGRCGAEELTELLNRYFAPMIDLLHTYGGVIGKFGGDAMTVLFPCEGDAPASAAHRAAFCALEMQARMGAYANLPTSAGQFSLTMKAGLAFGNVFCTIVGDPALRLETVLAGSAIDQCAAAEHHAASGEVVAHASLLAVCDQVAESEPRGAFARLHALKSPAAVPPPAPPVPPDDANQPLLRAFIHPSLARRIADGQRSFIDEHRKVTCLFAAFEGFDYDGDPQVGERLQSYLSQAIAVIQRYDGYLNKVDTGDKGSKLLALFGAPIAHENDAERALRCALELASLPGAAARIGVTTGFVFCGLMGDTAPGDGARCEYAVMGDDVNLAARLMQVAGSGETWVADSTQSETPRQFQWEPRRVIQVKGKSEPVGVRRLLGLRHPGMRLQELEYPLPMIGRERELDTVRQRLNRVLHGQGQILGITADAGMGKSRLAAEIYKLALRHGLTAYGGECLSHGANTSYLVWQNLLRGFFGLDADWPLARQQAAIEDELQHISPEWAQLAPLLGLPLNLPIPANEVTRSLDARFRKQSLEALLVACIRQRASETPLLLVFEDCHWIDPLSNELLETIARNIADLPALLLVVYRPPESEQAAVRVSRFAHFSEIRLSEFTPQEAEELIALKLARLFGQSGGLDSVLAARINEKAQGNPFYIDEIVNLIHDRGLDPADPQSLRNLELPASLHSLIISRMDQLDEDAKTTLKVASVIGRSFKASWLWGIYPNLGAPEAVKAQLAQLSRLDITPLDKPEPELEFLFKHIVTREVAYESLSAATRAMLHEATGDFIETQFGEADSPSLDLLAHHYGLSHNRGKQRHYFRLAGDAARAAFANEAAIGYYRRLLPLLDEAQQPAVWLELGAVLQLVGRWEAADEAYQQARRLAETQPTPDVLARAHYAAGALCRYRGEYPQALEQLNDAFSLFQTQGQPQGALDCLKETGIVHWCQGDYPAAMACFSQCRTLADQLGDRRALYQAIGNMGLIYEMDGDLQQAMALHTQGRQIAQEIGDRMGQSIAAGNLGNIYLEWGDYPNALACYSQNLHLASEMGYRLGVSIAVGNLGNVYWWQGDFTAASACQLTNLQIALEMGDWLGISRALWNIAATWAEEGRPLEASALLEKAIRIARALDTPDELCEFLRLQGDLLARIEQWPAALAASREARQSAGLVENKDVAFKAALRETVAQARSGELPLPAAIAALQQLAAGESGEREQADAGYEIVLLDPGRVAESAAAAAIYRRLYAQTPNFEIRRRFEALSGERLPAPPPLPPLPEIITRQTPDSNRLLTQLDYAMQAEIAPAGR